MSRRWRRQWTNSFRFSYRRDTISGPEQTLELGVIINPIMVPLGYMAKHVAIRPEWLRAAGIDEILSVSSCVSKDFADWITYWRHNGYWLFDNPSVIQALALEHSLNISDCRWFYYEAHGLAYDENTGGWVSISAEATLPTSVQPPPEAILRGFDVVTYTFGNMAECSPLSCNYMAKEVVTNRCCLLDSFEVAHRLIDQRRFIDCEPGPYRIVAVYEVSAPTDQ